MPQCKLGFLVNELQAMFLQGQFIRSVSGKAYQVLREMSDLTLYESGATFYKLRDGDGDVITLESDFVNKTFELITE